MTGADEAAGHGGRGYCGGRKRDGSGETCRRPAGWGTPSKTGKCRLHGGNTPSHRRHAERAEAERAVATYGLPVDVDPREALLQEVHRTAGHVAWLAEVVAALSDDALGWSVAEQTTRRVVIGQDRDGDGGQEGEVVDTKRRAAPHVLVTMYQAERKHLREVSRDAVNAGVAERAVQLAEQQGTALAGAVRAILADLNLSADQLALVPTIVPRHLRAVMANGNGAV